MKDKNFNLQVSQLSPKYINFLNVSMDIDTLKCTKEKCSSIFNYDFEVKKNLPEPATWVSFLSKRFEEDDVQTLQEYIGYGLVPNKDAGKMLFIQGATTAEIMTIREVLLSIFNDNLVIAKLRESSKSSNAAGMLANKLMFLDDNVCKLSLAGVSLLKTLITSSEITIKGKLTNIPTHFICFGEEIDKSLIITNGMEKCVLLLNMKPNSHCNYDVHTLRTELEKETDQIGMWMLRGLKRFYTVNNKIFTSAQKSENLIIHLLTYSYGISDIYNVFATIFEHFKEDEGIVLNKKASVSSKKLQSAFGTWAKSHGYTNIFPDQLSTFLNKYGYRYGVKRLYHLRSECPDGRMRGYAGIGLPDDEETTNMNENVCIKPDNKTRFYLDPEEEVVDPIEDDNFNIEIPENTDE